MDQTVTREQENNPHNLQVGLQYWFRYLPCNGPWEYGMCTRITKFGHPWVEGTKHNGIISPGLYEVQIIQPEIRKVEKTYTRSEVIELCRSAFNRTINLPHNTTIFSEWLKHNLK